MDPVGVFEHASNVLVFISFVTGLLDSDDEVHNDMPSDSGVSTASPEATPSKTSFDSIFDRIVKLGMDLDIGKGFARQPQRQDEWKEIRDHTAALYDISAACKDDYELLTEALCQVRNDPARPYQWASFRSVIEGHLPSQEHSAMKDRLHAAWKSLTEHFTALTGLWLHRYELHSKQQQATSQKHQNDIPQHFRHQAEISSCLQDLTKTIQETTQRAALLKDTNHVSAEEVAFYRTQLSNLSYLSEDVRKEYCVIASLAFEGQDERFKSISDTCEPMFDWLYTSANNAKSFASGSQLSRWLKRGHGLAWISGESGAGKSILMKHIANHPDLCGQLYTWSNPKTSVIASHYFCNPGTPMQRSQKGLLQTLLRTIFMQLPDLAKTACGELWNDSPEQLRDRQWTDEQLKEVLRNILTAKLTVKICLFIDGLDEFEGDYDKLVVLLDEIARSPNMKVCVSSLPIQPFTNSFGGVAMRMSLEGLTREDVQLFVAKRLESHPIWTGNRATAEERRELARTVANKSNSNFLWSRLATDQLRVEYREGQNRADVQRALSALPSNLEGLVRHILAAVPNDLVEAGAYALRVALTVREPAPSGIYSFLNEERRDSDYALKLEPRAASPQRLQHLLPETLQSRSGGLLEVRADDRVEFVHRAVRDTVDTPVLVSALCSKGRADQKVHLSLARAYLAYMKSTRLSWGRPTFSYIRMKQPPFFRALGELLAAARELDDDPRMYRLLDDLEAQLLAKQRSDQARLGPSDRAPVSIRQHLRTPVLEAMLVNYVDNKLSQDPKYFKDFEKPVCSMVISSMFPLHADAGERERHAAMIRCLLRHGFNPNERHQIGRDVRTPWTEFVRSSLTAELGWSLRSGLYLSMLESKADPNAPVWASQIPMLGHPRRGYTCAWVLFMYSVVDLQLTSGLRLGEGERKDMLEVLDMMMKRGASADSHPAIEFVTKPEEPEDAWVQSFLGHILKMMGSSSSADVLLCAGIIERFLVIMVRSRAAVTWSWTPLEEALSVDLFETLKGKVMREIEHRKRSTEVSGVTVPAKRGSDDPSDDSGGSSKRPRSIYF